MLFLLEADLALKEAVRRILQTMANSHLTWLLRGLTAAKVQIDSRTLAALQGSRLRCICMGAPGTGGSRLHCTCMGAPGTGSSRLRCICMGAPGTGRHFLRAGRAAGSVRDLSGPAYHRCLSSRFSMSSAKSAGSRCNNIISKMMLAFALIPLPFGSPAGKLW
jgi:hypothetical protein